ncbi:hypothetical protein CBR_g54089 [Chara braunii]|uniref:DUF659 domain-containing protein n=1 Tax=Chara braunii TaxID=69332 RepID=A0A388MBQ0_CHABU|nr:hypothetical protein CBR_g54089 [Chara braunii]|eukprot:GBG91994.1 hypothetical protein CBR_g54089 [Chara braunii]
MHDDHKLRCNYCKVIYEGNQSKAARHFTQPKKCKQAPLSVLADIWNKTRYKFDLRHVEGILRYMEEMGIADARSLSGRGTQRRQPSGGFGADRDDDMMDVVDEVEAFLDREARREADAMRGTAEVGGEGGSSPPHWKGEEVVMTARSTGGGSRDAGQRERANGKMHVDEVDDDIAEEGRKKPRQTTMDEVYDGDAQQRTRSTFLEWVYDVGIRFRAFRRSSWRRHRKAVAELPRGVRMVCPSHKEIGGRGVIEKRDEVATRLAHVRASFEVIGATIVTDGRRSTDLRPIINFLAAGKHVALLYATVCRDAFVPETGEIVLRRWKAIFRSFPPNHLLAICTDSASNYTSAAELLAKGADPELHRITWLPCATHICNLMLSDIGTRVDCISSAILRGRALVRFIKMHGAALHLFRSKSKRKSLVQPVETRFTLVFMMLLCLKERRDALESMLHDEAWDNIPWKSRLVDEAVWVRQTIRDGLFWRDVEYGILVMTLIHQLLRRLDRRGMVMSLAYSWIRRVVDELRRLQDGDRIPSEILDDYIKQVLARRQHMLEPAHAARHLLNPRRRHLRYYDERVRTAEDLEVVQECDNFFLAQTGGDRAGARYLRTREEMRQFHARMGPMLTDPATRDAEAQACRGDDETPRCAAWWQEHGGAYPDLQEIATRMLNMWTSASPAERNWAEHERVCTARRNRLEFTKVAQLVEIATNLKLLECSESSTGYVLPWGYLDAQDKVEGEDEPEPLVWGARPRASVTEEELASTRRRLQPLGSRRPHRVSEVFGARATVLLPYEAEVPEGEVVDDATRPARDDAIDGDEDWTLACLVGSFTVGYPTILPPSLVECAKSGWEA